MPRSNLIQIRVSDEEKERLAKAAYQDGSDLSPWLRALGLKEVIRRESQDQSGD